MQNDANQDIQNKSQADSGLLKWVVGGVVLALISYFLFRALLNTPEASAEAPGGFSHFGVEVTSAFVGTGLTVAITALLLKFQTDKQTEQQEKLLKQQNKHAETLLDLQTKNDKEMRAIEAGHNTKLLDLQFERDAAKEKGVTVFATKAEVYKALLDELGEIISKPVLREDDFSQLTLLTLRAAYVAQPEVLKELAVFAKVLKEAVNWPNEPNAAFKAQQGGETDAIETDADDISKQITREERLNILYAFNDVSSVIRQDLLGEKPKLDLEFLRETIQDFSIAGKIAEHTAQASGAVVSSLEPVNTNLSETALTNEVSEVTFAKAPLPKMTLPQFLEQCKEPGEREFFENLVPLLETNKFVPLWTSKGFSIDKTIRFHPSAQDFPKWRSYIDRPALSKRREKVEAALVAAGVNISFTEKPDLRFDWEQMKGATPEGFLEVVKAVLR